MKKLVLAFAMLFAGQLAFAQAWQGKGDQKLQVGFNGYGNGTGVTATYDYGLSNVVSLGAGANFYFDGYRDNNEDNNVFVFGRVNFHLQDALNMPSKWDLYPGLDVGSYGKQCRFQIRINIRFRS